MKLTGVAAGYKRYMWAPESLQVPVRVLTDRCFPVSLICVCLCFMWLFIFQEKVRKHIDPSKTVCEPTSGGFTVESVFVI